MESKSVIELFLYQLLEVLAGDRCVIGIKRDNELLVSVSRRGCLLYTSDAADE